ncbi:hypothetical protein RGQ29_008682 [Quercus rubra]|uniref:Cytochrome P450 n=1 Tax=Quercus rubra TaxID=3512 RepID=A0AAN7I904_QUERU|nr:hypothetical protein RGQ29_008682 [Quercus rubra]
MDYLPAIGIVASIIFLISKILQICRILIWRPYALTKHFKKQGIVGPPCSFLYGSLHEVKKMNMAARQTVLDANSHDITPRVLPHYHKWSSLYGETFLYWFGMQPRICISDPELAKQILSNKFGFYVKPSSRPSVQTLLGNKGLVLNSGMDWAKHRRIINPAFSLDKLKVMVKRMTACTISKLDEWKNQVVAAEDHCHSIEMNGEFKELTADIIAHTAFGSSYAQGREVFEAQVELQKYCAATHTDIFIPGSQYLPTPLNLQIWKLDKKVRTSLKCIIKRRLNSKATGSSCEVEDLLGLMLEASESEGKPKLNVNEIVEECKTFFFAGHETSSNLLTWTVFLLSLHPEWQEKLRQEVLKECGMGIPDADMLTKLKLVNMVLLEALRLYGPGIELFRQPTKDMKLGDVMIPKGTCISIPFVKIHRRKEYWGEDVNKFNPMRFINGISKAAKHPNALLAFSMGPRACIGQNFAMLEAKSVIVLILQRFSLCLSPEYKHAPVELLTLQPQHGLPIIVKPLHL